MKSPFIDLVFVIDMAIGLLFKGERPPWMPNPITSLREGRLLSLQSLDRVAVPAENPQSYSYWKSWRPAFRVKDSVDYLF